MEGRSLRVENYWLLFEHTVRPFSLTESEETPTEDLVFNDHFQKCGFFPSNVLRTHELVDKFFDSPLKLFLLFEKSIDVSLQQADLRITATLVGSSVQIVHNFFLRTQPERLALLPGGGLWRSCLRTPTRRDARLLGSARETPSLSGS